jgi:thiol:disulfide interchange protein DsbD
LHGASLNLIGSLGLSALLAFAAPVQAISVSERLQEFVGRDPAPDEILPPEQAFPLKSEPEPAGVDLVFDIRDGYYLYRDKFSFSVIDGAASVDMAALSLPRGIVKEDEAFGRVEVHVGELALHVPLARRTGDPIPLRLRVGYQGCKDKSVCYPPQTTDVAVTLPPATGSAVAAPGVPAGAAAALAGTAGVLAGLEGAGFAANLLAFFAFGVLLSLTACVYPMVPILSGIIIGHDGHVSHGRAFALSLAYVLAMALTYAVLGVFAGLTHFNLQAAAQTPWVIVLFSGVLLLLAASMFGLFRLQMPARVQSWLHGLAVHQHAGTLRGSAAMGALSALIVGPCVAPPLAAALLYITQTGDAVLGGAALFALGFGLGLPLLVLGASAGWLLPRAGYWMESVRRTCGFVMIGVAVWFLGRILPGPATLLLWGVLLLVAALHAGALERLDGATPWRRTARAFGIALLVWGAALVVGAASGGDDPLRPLAPLTGATTVELDAPLPFRPVASVEDLRAELERARAAGRPVMLDFYADWCITCKELERETFPDPRVRARLADVVLLQADVTGYTRDHQRLLNELGLYGPPAILFFDTEARELRHWRVDGFLDADAFLAHLARVSGS